MSDTIKRLQEELTIWQNALMNARTCTQAVSISAEVKKIKAQINEATV